MKKTLGVLITLIWVTALFYFFNILVPKNFLYSLIALPIVYVTSSYILKKSGFNSETSTSMLLNLLNYLYFGIISAESAVN